jgi:hypothetical protein
VADFEGHDEDCDPVTFGVLDRDGDGFTDARAYNEPWGTSRGEHRGADCDDERNDVRPGQVEVCNHRDDNCDGRVDEDVTLAAYRDADGDLFGDPASPLEICFVDLRAGIVTNDADCDDTDATRNPAAGNCPRR